MTRKKFIKTLMGMGVQRDTAKNFARRFAVCGYTYSEAKKTLAVKELVWAGQMFGGSGNLAPGTEERWVSPKIKPLRRKRTHYGYRANILIIDEIHEYPVKHGPFEAGGRS